MINFILHKTNKILSKLKVIDKIDFILLNKKKIAIVSNNCWNIRIYKNLKQPYNTPFVGLFISTPDFINMLPNLQNFLHLELKQSHFIKNDNYPIAILDGVKINFLHYKNSSSSIEKWNKRRLRLINFINENGLDSVIFKCCDSDSFDNNDQYKFDKLKFKRKIYFKNIKNSMIMNLDGTFPDGIQLYKIRIAYYFKFIKLFRGL